MLTSKLTSRIKLLTYQLINIYFRRNEWFDRMSNLDYLISPKKMKTFLDSSINKGLKDKDFTASQAHFLRAIGEKRGASMKDLCLTLGVNKGLGTRAIKALIKNGYVVNRSESSRTYKLYLTDKGREGLDLAMDTLERALGQVFECLDEQELKCLEKITKKINDRLDELYTC